MLSKASKSSILGPVKASDLYLPPEQRVFQGKKQKTSEERKKEEEEEEKKRQEK